MQTVSNKWGCSQSVQIDQFGISQQFLVQNQNSKRVYFMEKLTSHVFSALWGGLFWLKANQVFDHFEFKIQYNCGSV